MPDIGEIIADNSKVGIGAVVGAAAYTMIDNQVEKIPVVGNFPETSGAVLAAAGVFMRISGAVPKELNRVADGITAAGLIGIVDQGMNRLSGKDIIAYN